MVVVPPDDPPPPDWRALGIVVCLASVLLLLALLVGCGPVHPPQPPAVPTWSLEVQTAANATVRVLDGPNAGRAGTASGAGRLVFDRLIQSGFTVCATADGFKEGCAGVTLTASQAVALPLVAVPPPVPPLLAVRPDGRIFRTVDGQPWRWKGVSAFALLDRFTRGEDIQPYLDAYRGFNLLRVWLYTDWPDRGWNVHPTADQITAFLRYVGDRGWTVEITLLTTDDPGRLAWAKGLVPELAAPPRPTNLLLEAGNEPETHKAIRTAELRSVLDASGFVYASGNYETSAKAFGSYLVHHSARDAEWPRKAHDCLEFYNGGGPHTKTDPAHRVPCVLDEPGKPQDAIGGTSKADDFRAYFGTAALLGAGATWHCETCKYAQVPTAEERTLAAAALEGLNAFPADAPLGPYSRPSDQSLRTYIVGPYMVRVRPTSPAVTGWTRTGASAVLWRR